MSAESSSGRLAEELRQLGRGTSRAPDEALVTSVMTRLAADPAEDPATARAAGRPTGWATGWARWRALAETLGRRRRRAVIVLVVLLCLLGVPPVRAAVVQWFGFDGVQVNLSPAPGPAGTPSPPPTAAAGLSVRDAASLVAFGALVPSALGPPDGVEVSTDRRVLSLTWGGTSGGTVRMDEFGGGLDYTFAKTAPEVEWLMIDDRQALWFSEPHEVSVLGADGQPRAEPPRLAGHTLIWEDGGTVLRLEGDVSKERAIEIVASVQPVT